MGTHDEHPRSLGGPRLRWACPGWVLQDPAPHSYLRTTTRYCYHRPMASGSRRSLLQIRILLRLQREPVRTVTDLAAAVEAHRPSVSRSLKTLQTQNLVHRGRNGWRLTVQGLDEAAKCNRELYQLSDSLKRTFSAVSSPGVMKAIDALSQSVANSFLNDPMTGLDLSSFASVSNELSKKILHPISPKIQDIMRQSLVPLADSQHRLSHMIAQSATVPDLGLTISQNNIMVAKAIEDIQAVYTTPNIRLHEFDTAFYPGVLRDIRDISASYGTLLSETANISAVGMDASDMQQTWSRMLLPSSTVANFTHSLRAEVGLESKIDGVVLSPLVVRDDPKELLDRLLTHLSPDLVDKWKGSWQAFGGSNPDRLSQAAASYRELIRMVLDELAPDVKADPAEQGSKRKTQVRQILEGREADFAGALVEGLSKLYDFLSKPAHTAYRNEVAVQAALTAGDGLLLLLLSNRYGHNS